MIAEIVLQMPGESSYFGRPDFNRGDPERRSGFVEPGFKDMATDNAALCDLVRALAVVTAARLRGR